MRPARLVWGSLALATVVWAVFTWPVPRYVASGIPCSDRNTERGAVRRMIAGDHLQLLYHFWLFADMLRGKTPWFYDLYEFNWGDDAARRRVYTGFFPYFLLQAAGEAVGTRALGYNLATLFSVWMLLLFTVLLAGRYTAQPVARWAAGLVGALLPYRWSVLLGGSPTGFGMAWVPLLALGLDVALRDLRRAGTWLALLGGLLVFASDIHTVFFAACFAPVWGLFALAANPSLRWRSPDDLRRLVRVAWPFLALAALAAACFLVWRGRTHAATLPQARAYSEIALYSPRPSGLVVRHAASPGGSIYLGWPCLLLLAAGLPAWALAALRDRTARRNLALLALLICGLAVLISLALGVFGPARGLLLVAVRKLLSPYRLIRQPAKVFLLMPGPLAVAVALALEGLGRAASPMRRMRALWLAWTLVAIPLDFARGVRATVCLLDAEQGAYRAVAEDARARGEAPRALALPLWGGDSVMSAPYLYYASLYRIRLPNGYFTLLPETYLAEVRRLKPLNQGWLSEDDADRLLARGIRALLFHENAYPETVSPFPVGVTLGRLRGHPRLELLARDGPVWAFRILERSGRKPASPSESRFFFPARRWEAEKIAHGPGAIARDHGASGGALARLRPGQGWLSAPPFLLTPAPDLRWMARARGAGRLVFSVSISTNRPEIHQQTAAVETTDWTWLSSSLPPWEQPENIGLEVRADGAVDVDMLFLTAGDWPTLAPRASVRIPADRFFRAGCSDPVTGSVSFRAEYEPAGVVLYGPKLPFVPGTYRVELDFETSAPPDAEVARVNIRRDPREPVAWHPVRAGEPFACSFAPAETLPVSLELLFTREADLTVRAVTFTRLE